MDSGFPGGAFQSLSVELGFEIAIVGGIPDSLSCQFRIPKPRIWDSRSKFSLKQNVLKFRNPDSVISGDL